MEGWREGEDKESKERTEQARTEQDADQMWRTYRCGEQWNNLYTDGSTHDTDGFFLVCGRLLLLFLLPYLRVPAFFITGHAFFITARCF